MAERINVCIGIQARSTSKRFPRKVFELIDGKPMLGHVIESCLRAAKYMNKFSFKTKTIVDCAILVPFGDEIKSAFGRKNIIVEGPEDDVLKRYLMAQSRLDADYMVRVTADCPLIPPFLISKHIKAAIANSFDYISNVDQNMRTEVDGFDCEVISKKALLWLGENAKETPDKEHVTTLLRRDPPEWAKVGHVIGYLNHSGIKLSVDTLEDLENVRKEYLSIKQMLERAAVLHGEGSVHRF